MANMKCKACGKRYSYHESDLCPNCGAYNKPSSRMRVDFDKDGNAELLNEQQFQQQSAANRQRKDCYEHETMRKSSETAAHRGGGGLTTGKLVGLAVGLVSLFIALCSLINTIGQRTPEGDWSSDVPIPAEEPAQEIADDYVFYYTPGEQFVIDGQPVIIESAVLEEDELRITVQEEEDSSILPDLYVSYANGSELLTYPGDMTPEDGNNWQYTYQNDGFGWENVTEAYLICINYGGGEEPYYEARVDITDVFQSIY